MGLYIDDTLISRQELCRKFTTPEWDGEEFYKKVVKRPEFEGKRVFIDAINGGKKRYNAGYNRLARFWIEDKKTQMPMEIRYAATRKYSKEKDGWDYQPPRVIFDGEGMQLSEDLDLAVFAALHPDSEHSPFHKGTKAAFEFVDYQARADKKVSDLDALGEALVHAKMITGLNQIILAKGLGIAGIDMKSEREITAELMDYASKNPKLYIEKKNQQLTMIDGKIEHFIDKDIFHMEQIGTVRRWTWTKGDKQGQTITDVMQQTANAREALKVHIKNHLEDFIFELNNLQAEVTANENAQKVLEKLGQTEVPEHLKSIGKNGALPTNFNEAVLYLTRMNGGKRPPNTKISPFLKAIEAGMDEEGAKEWFEQNMKNKIGMPV
jgi:hypothetical protein